MSKILGVGIATLDIINIVDHFPHEDEEMRTVAQRLLRGGNCTNTLITLSQLGNSCAWAGTLSDEPNAQIIVDELDRFNIDQSAVKVIKGARLPTSYITLNQQNGSRTIIHHRELAEYDFARFAEINLDKYQWIHFEGRNVEQLKQMLKHVKALYPEKTISLEVEKPREGIEALFVYTDVLLFARAYARDKGQDTADTFLKQLQLDNKKLFCGWGSQGAYAREANADYFVAAQAPGPVIDTIGAGDVFNAGVIHALAKGETTETALNFAVKLAGEHCCREGFHFKD